MNHRLLQTLGCLLLPGLQAGVAPSLAALPSSAPPNFVVIIADDVGWDDVAPYSSRGARTPTLARLAREGLRFDRAFLTCSSCSPSRSSIITGRYPHATGAEQLHWPLPAAQTTFVEKLKAAGYYTASVGKWHLGDAVKDRFDLVLEPGAAGYQLGVAGGEAGRLKASADPSGCARWVDALRARPRSKPFFFWLASLDAHRDYEPSIIDRPHKPEDVSVPPYLPDLPATRADLALYYDEITRLDGFIARVLDELDLQGVAKDTLVLFLSDNGRPFPRDKTTVYDSGIKTPLLVRWPGHVAPGSVTGSLVSVVDIAPTLLELAGVEAPATFQGRSFAPVFQDPSSPGRHHVFAERNWHDFDSHARAVRDARFKYIRSYDAALPLTPPADAVRSPTYQAMRRLGGEGRLPPSQMVCFGAPRPPEELYDCEADPDELRNLALDPAHAETLAELRAALDAWQKETDDEPKGLRAPDEFDRETGRPLPNRKRPRPTREELLKAAGSGG